VPTTDRGARRRARLLVALEETLGERPYAAVGVDEVARRAGVSRSAFYFYFPTKAAAVAALIGEVHGHLIGVALDWYERDDLPHDERVRRGMGATVAWWREHAHLMVAMFDAAHEDADVRAGWTAMVAGLAQRAAARIEADRAAGLAPSGPPAAAELAETLTGMTLHAMERDVRAVAEGAQGLPGTLETLAHVWDAAVYGR
jgi:AcrR family transcriptional regulator